MRMFVKAFFFFVILARLIPTLEATTIGFYSLHSGDQNIKDIPLELVDEIVCSSFVVGSEGQILLKNPDYPIDTEASKQLEQLKQLKLQALEKSLPLQIAISISVVSAEEKSLVKHLNTDPQKKKFVKDLYSLCEKYLLDGIDLGLSLPTTKPEGEQLLSVIKEVHQTFQKSHRPLKVTLSVPGHPTHAKYYPWELISRYVQAIYVKSFDLHGPWKDHDNRVTNHQCALNPPSIGNHDLCVTAVMRYYKKFFPEEKLYLGIPLHFNCYADANKGVNRSHYGSAYTGPVLQGGGKLAYKDVRKKLEQGTLAGYWDDKAEAFSIFDAENRVYGTGLNEKSVEAMMRFANKEGFGGIVVWNLNADTDKWEVVRMLSSQFSK